MIRISGGDFRSRLLKTPNTDLTKPTMDKVRLGIFSAINERIINADVLDLFAGCGSYGFEALSRGAKSATFIDNGYEQVNVIKENASNLNVNINVYLKDSLSFLNECPYKYDVIFCDPPYKLDVYEKVVDIILQKELLNDFGIIVLESERELNIDESKFSKVKMYKYGLSKVYLLRK